ncbi:MAG: MlaD family protein [Desulfuromonadales bacterium]|nr:MlaD family protein [Desulfuromonadales bacterium]MDH4023907.1 MlaD family protein [Desulfuromonadales bacterium]
MMSNKANPTVIGAFVLGAIGLVIVGLVIFGSGKLFKKTEVHVLYFKGSVKGLTLGSPVSFRGVPIGQVSAIRMIINSETLDIDIPVLVDIDPTRFQVCCDEQGQLINRVKDPDKTVNNLIKKGLRGKLAVQSLVTGQLMVDLDFYPGTPVNLVSTDSRYHEIPTIPSQMQAFLEKLQNIPIDKIAQKVSDVLDSIDDFVRTPELKGSVVALDQALKDVQHLTKNLDERIGKLFGNANATMSDARKFINNLDDEVKPLSSEIHQIGTVAQDTLQQADKVMVDLQGLVGENSDVRIEALQMLREITDAMRSIKVLVQYLETHPESLLRGKSESGGQP